MMLCSGRPCNSLHVYISSVIHLNVSTKRERRDIYNVIATIKGNVEPGN